MCTFYTVSRTKVQVIIDIILFFKLAYLIHLGYKVHGHGQSQQLTIDWQQH